MQINLIPKESRKISLRKHLRPSFIKVWLFAVLVAAGAHTYINLELSPKLAYDKFEHGMSLLDRLANNSFDTGEWSKVMVSPTNFGFKAAPEETDSRVTERVAYTNPRGDSGSVLAESTTLYQPAATGSSFTVTNVIVNTAQAQNLLGSERADQIDEAYLDRLVLYNIQKVMEAGWLTVTPVTPTVSSPTQQYAPITYIQPNPQTNMSGVSLFSATDLSSQRLYTEDATISDQLTVEGNSILQGDLTVSGTITGAISGTIDPGFTTGSIIIQGASGLAEDNANFFWDDTDNQLGIGTNTPAASAIVEINSTTKGFLAPRMTTVQRDAITSPATGLMVYNTTTNKYNVYDGSSWTSVGSTAIGGAVDSGTVGSALFVGAGGLLAQDNANFFWNDTNNRLGIGTAAPTTPLHVTGADNFADIVNLGGTYNVSTIINPNYTTDTGDAGAMGLIGSLNISTGSMASAANFIGTLASVNYTGSATFPAGTQMTGLTGNVLMSGTGSIPYATGGSFGVVRTTGNTANNAIGVSTSFYNLDGTGTTGSLSGLLVAQPVSTAGHTITNTYGVYIADQTNTAGTQTNAPYGIYQAGAADLNYLGGYLGINTLAPSARFSVETETSASYIFSLSQDSNDALWQSWIEDGGIGITDGALYWDTSGVSGSMAGAMAWGMQGRLGLGIGYNTIDAGLQVKSTAAAVPGVLIQGHASQSANLMTIENSGGTDLFVVDSAGNVGVGDASPNSLFTVGSGDLFQIASNGNLTSSNAGTWTFSNDTNFALTGGTNGLSIDGTTFSVDGANDRIGIGVAAPLTKLHVVDGTTANAAGQEILRLESDYAGGTVGSGSKIQFVYTGGTATAAIRGYTFGPGDTGLSFDTGWGGNTTKMVINNAGSIGIGTTGPDRKLDVLDASNPQLRLTYSDGSVYTDLQTNSSGYLHVTPTGNRAIINGANMTASSGDANLIINSTTTAAADIGGSLAFAQGGTNYAFISGRTDGAGGNPGYMIFSTRDSGNTVAERMRITNSGFVGIGVAPTGNPTQGRLHVSNTVSTADAGIYVSNTSNNGGSNGYGVNVVRSGTANRNYAFYGEVSGTATNVGAYLQTENAATNTTSELLRLISRSSGTAANNIGAQINFYTEDDNNGEEFAGSIAGILTNATHGAEAGALVLSSRAAEGLRIAHSGFVGIGDTSPDTKLDVEGDSTATYIATFFNDGNNANRYGIEIQGGADDGSGTTYYLNALDGDGTQVGYIANTSGTFALTDVSDARTKTNIQTSQMDAMEILTGLRVVDFNRISNPNGPQITGFIAQEVQAVYPKIVTEGENGYLGITKENLIPVLVKGFQEQQSQIASLQVSLNMLQGNSGGNLPGDAPLVLASHLYLSGDSVGEAKILAGSTSVRVSFAKPYKYQPIVTTTPDGRVGSEYWVADRDSGGFTIYIDASTDHDVTFNWHSFAGELAKLTISNGTQHDIPLVVASALTPVVAPQASPQEQVLGDSDQGGELVVEELAPDSAAEPEEVPAANESFSPRGEPAS